MAVQPPKAWESRWNEHDALPLPPDWEQRRQAVAARAGGRCQSRVKLPSGEFRRCPQPGSECDHKVGRQSHELDDLQWLCRRCHAIRTQAQSAEARRLMAAKLRHPRSKHPGLL